MSLPARPMPPDEAKPKVAQRFWPKVSIGADDECWPWLAYRNPGGYGRFSLGGRSGVMKSAHRVAYWLSGLPVSEDQDVDHLCRNPACVNPSHLEAVSHRENGLRGVAADVNRARMRAVSACRWGHAYVPENTYVRPTGGRGCRTCRREQDEARRRGGVR